MTMQAILFDLDNTLYAPERQLFALIDVRINRYMQEVVGIPAAEVDGLRRRYWVDYGVTMGGLMRHHQIDPEDYLAYVHDVDVADRLSSDPLLRQALAHLPLRRAIFTNGCSRHADRVLAQLGLDGLFEQVFDIRVANYRPKPYQEPYLQVIQHLGVAAQHCLMVEDTVENLRTAKALGMGTIMVGRGEIPAYVDVQVASAAEVPQALAAWGL
jgi:putative hydrolase of the HAD superfamily